MNPCKQIHNLPDVREVHCGIWSFLNATSRTLLVREDYNEESTDSLKCDTQWVVSMVPFPFFSSWRSFQISVFRFCEMSRHSRHGGGKLGGKTLRGVFNDKYLNQQKISRMRLALWRARAVGCNCCACTAFFCTGRFAKLSELASWLTRSFSIFSFHEHKQYINIYTSTHLVWL